VAKFLHSVCEYERQGRGDGRGSPVWPVYAGIFDHPSFHNGAAGQLYFTGNRILRGEEVLFVEIKIFLNSLHEVEKK
jgi:hypothetical protein